MSYIMFGEQLRRDVEIVYCMHLFENAVRNTQFVEKSLFEDFFSLRLKCDACVVCACECGMCVSVVCVCVYVCVWIHTHAEGHVNVSSSSNFEITQ